VYSGPGWWAVCYECYEVSYRWAVGYEVSYRATDRWQRFHHGVLPRGSLAKQVVSERGPSLSDTDRVRVPCLTGRWGGGGLETHVVGSKTAPQRY